MKECFKCGESKQLSEFYKHPQMKDGHVNKCKECNKRDVTDNRNLNVDYYREYDRNRGSRETQEYANKYKESYPNKYKAQTLVNNSIAGGKLFREPCEVCNTTVRVHAHHDDYLKPLNVRWLCPVHHFEWHTENGEGLNG